MKLKKIALGVALLSATLAAHAGPFGVELAAGTTRFSGEGLDAGDFGAYGVNATYSLPMGLGAELGWRRHGRMTASDDSGSAHLRADSTQLGLTYDYKVAPSWALGGRLGVHFWEIKGSGFGASDKVDGTDPYVAVGVKYLANNNLSVGVFYNWYRMDDQDVTVRAKSVDLRVGYSF